MLPKEKKQFGSDVIVNLLKQYDVEYVAFNPGATIRGLQDSLVNANASDLPKILLCCHEEIAVAIAHGYAKASGKIMAVLLHSNVGLQHASMAIFNAWVDKVPILIINGVGPLDATKRRPWIDWIHMSNQQSSIVKDFVKWLDQPQTIEAAVGSLRRAFKIASTEPKAPVLIELDALEQEKEMISDFKLGSSELYSAPASPQISEENLTYIADRLVKAKQPVIVADYLGRSDGSVFTLVKLSELLGIAVVDRGNRFNFPSDHPLNITGFEEEILNEADLILALDVQDLEHALGKYSMHDEGYSSFVSSAANIIEISLFDYMISRWSADYGALYPVNLSVLADTEKVLPSLYQKCLSLDLDKKSIQERAVFIANKQKKRRAEWLNLAKNNENCSPLSLPSVLLKIWSAIKNENWLLTNEGSVDTGKWLRKLWNFKQPRSHLGFSGGAGLGYGLGASIGAAIANKDNEKICIDIQSDGDFLFTPSALWTLANESIPLIIIVMNNRSYNNTKEHAKKIAKLRAKTQVDFSRGSDIASPFVDYPALARSFDVDALDTVFKLDDLGFAVEKAISFVKQSKKPILIDVVIE